MKNYVSKFMRDREALPVRMVLRIDAYDWPAVAKKCHSG